MNDFENNISKLKEFYHSYPEKTEQGLSLLVSKLENYDNTRSFNKIINNSKYITMALFILFFIIVLLGLMNFNELYYGGLIFFIAGYCVGLIGNSFTAIFIYSHGITGLVIMIIASIGKVMSSPIMTDAPTSLYFYLGSCIFLCILATALLTFYNFSKYYQKLPYFKLIPLIIYAIAIFLFNLLPYIIDKL